MTKMKVDSIIEILNSVQAKGAAIEVDLKVLPGVTLQDARDANKLTDYRKAVQIYYSLYLNEENLDQKITLGIALSQELINASNLDKAEEVLNDLEKMSEGKEKYMGAIWEKRGWIADYRDKWDDEINFFEKAGEIYERNPEALEIEGHKDDRLLTVEHFTGRALFLRGRKSDLGKCEEIFMSNLDGYKKLNSDGGVAFNYSWLARVYIAMGDLDKAEEMVNMAEECFDKEARVSSESIKTYSFRVKAQLAYAKGDQEQAVKYAAEALRFVLPSGTYYNGVIEAVKEIVKASK